MIIRSKAVQLVNNPDTSTLIGYLTSQQRLAYNHAIDILNRRPNIPKRARENSRFGLNKTLTAWRQKNRTTATAPYHIHQQGSEAAWEANQRLQQKRGDRLDRIARAEAKGKEPHHRDVRPHRRTLTHRSRKHGTQTLTVRSSQFIKVLDAHSFKIEGVKTTFHTKDPLPDNMRSLHFVELPDYRHSANAPLRCRRYELHVSVGHDDPEPPDLANVPLSKYEGADDGVKNNITFSNDEVFHFKEPYPNRNVQEERRTAKGKKKGSKRGRRHASRCAAKTRKRSAERKRQANLHLADHLDRTQPAAVCVENKSLKSMMSSAKGTGKARKAGLNRSLTAAGLGELAQILADQCVKRGIHIIPVPPQGSSQSCPRCGNRQRKNRKTQAIFQCLNCGWTGHADRSAARILRNRGFVRTTERIHRYTPSVEDAPTGWREQPSLGGQQPLLLPGENTPKPKRNATRPARHRRSRPGSGAPSPTAQVRTQSSLTLFREPSPETGHAEVVQSASRERLSASINVCKQITV